MKKKFLVHHRLAFYSIIFFLIYVVLISFTAITQINSSEKVSSPIGIDYMMLYTSGKTAIEGKTTDIYDVPKQQAIIEEMLGTEMPKDVQWFYPPTFLLAIVSLFSALPFYPSLIIWLVCTLIFTIFSAYMLVPKYKVLALLTLGFPAVFFNFRWGQNSFLSTSLLGLGIAFMQSNPVLAGLMFGLMTYKPQLACFPFIILLVTKEWRVLRWSAFFSLLTVLVSIFILGTNVWFVFLNHFFNKTPALLTTIWIKTAGIQPTLYTTLRLFGINGIFLKFLIILVGTTVTLVIMMIWRTANSLALRGSAMVLGIFTFMPYFIQYDLMLLSIPFILLTYDFIENGCNQYEIVVLAALWLMPMFNIIIVNLTHFQISPFTAIVTLILILNRAKRKLTG
jgi:alpha-1,2-mannosyltransferase